MSDLAEAIGQAVYDEHIAPLLAERDALREELAAAVEAQRFILAETKADQDRRAAERDALREERDTWLEAAEVAERDRRALREELERYKELATKLDTNLDFGKLYAESEAEVERLRWLRERAMENASAIATDNDRLYREQNALREELERVREALACPAGCGCEFPFDPTDCACDGACVSIEWATLQQLLEPSLPERNE